MKRKLSMIVCICLSVVLGYAQDTTSVGPRFDSAMNINPGLHKNIMYVTGGVFPGTYFGGNLERILIGGVKSHMIARVGVGKIHEKLTHQSSFMNPYPMQEVKNYRIYMAGLGILTGKRNSHLEFTFGGIFLDGTVETRETGVISLEDDEMFTPTLSLGYRYQEPGGHVVFRMGGGWPEMIFLSLGFCF